MASSPPLSFLLLSSPSFTRLSSPLVPVVVPSLSHAVLRRGTRDNGGHGGVPAFEPRPRNRPTAPGRTADSVVSARDHGRRSVPDVHIGRLRPLVHTVAGDRADSGRGRPTVPPSADTVVFDSVGTLTMYSSFERVYRFLRALTRRLAAANAVGCFSMQPVLSETELTTMANVFDGVRRLPRTRGERRTPGPLSRRRHRVVRRGGASGGRGRLFVDGHRSSSRAFRRSAYGRVCESVLDRLHDSVRSSVHTVANATLDRRRSGCTRSV